MMTFQILLKHFSLGCVGRAASHCRLYKLLGLFTDAREHVWITTDLNRRLLKIFHREWSTFIERIRLNHITYTLLVSGLFKNLGLSVWQLEICLSHPVLLSSQMSIVQLDGFCCNWVLNHGLFPRWCIICHIITHMEVCPSHVILQLCQFLMLFHELSFHYLILVYRVSCLSI